MADTIKARVTNKASGARGIWANREIVDIQPGKSRVMDFADQAEIDAADTASFTIETGEAAEAPVSNRRLFLALADSDDHANFRLVDLGGATVIGIAMGDDAPILPGGYRWGPVNEPAGPFAAPADDDADEDELDAMPKLFGQTKAALIEIAAAEGVETAKGDDGADVPIADATAKQITAAIKAAREPA